MKYLLPCDACGESAEVEIAQAGQKIRCSCGAELEVPSMRGVRALQPAPEVGPVGARRSWTPGRGVAFGCGLVLIVLGSLPAGYGAYIRTKLDLSKPPAMDIAAARKEVNAVPLALTLSYWNEAKDGGLGPYVPPTYVLMRRYDKVMQVVTLVGVGMMILGAILLGGSMAFRPKRRA